MTLNTAWSALLTPNRKASRWPWADAAAPDLAEVAEAADQSLEAPQQRPAQPPPCMLWSPSPAPVLGSPRHVWYSLFSICCVWWTMG